MSSVATLPDIDDTLKLRFAEGFLRTKNAANTAMDLIADTGQALRAARMLPHDPVVLAEMDRLKEEVGEEGFLPNRAQIAREIYDRAKLCGDPEGYERLMKLYANVRGFIEKPGATINVDNSVKNVMYVKDHGTDEEWAAKAAIQQRNLTLDAINVN